MATLSNRSFDPGNPRRSDFEPDEGASISEVVYVEEEPVVVVYESYASYTATSFFDPVTFEQIPRETRYEQNGTVLEHVIDGDLEYRAVLVVNRETGHESVHGEVKKNGVVDFESKTLRYADGYTKSLVDTYHEVVEDDIERAESYRRSVREFHVMDAQDQKVYMKTLFVKRRKTRWEMGIEPIEDVFTEKELLDYGPNPNFRPTLRSIIEDEQSVMGYDVDEILAVMLREPYKKKPQVAKPVVTEVDPTRLLEPPVVAYDLVYGTSTGLRVVVETGVSPDEVGRYLDGSAAVAGLELCRVSDAAEPLFYDGFSVNAVECRWPVVDEPGLVEVQLGQVLELAEWEAIVFGGCWVGKRPTVVWDETGVHFFTDEPAVSRSPINMIERLLESRRVAHHRHRREQFPERIKLGVGPQTAPSPKDRIVNHADWVETEKNLDESDQRRFLNRQESVEVVLARIKFRSGLTYRMIDQGINVVRLHQSLNLRDILDHLEETGVVRTELTKKQKKGYYLK